MPPKLKLSQGPSASGLVPVTLTAWYAPDRAGDRTESLTADLRIVFDLSVLSLDSASSGAHYLEDSANQVGTVLWQDVSVPKDGTQIQRTARLEWFNTRVYQTTVEGLMDVGVLAGVAKAELSIDQPIVGREPFVDMPATGSAARSEA